MYSCLICHSPSIDLLLSTICFACISPMDVSDNLISTSPVLNRLRRGSVDRAYWAKVDSSLAPLGGAAKLRRTLHAHHGRDKLFKVIQYSLRLVLWLRGIRTQLAFVSTTDQFTAMERNLMTITNTRRMFRVGRFVAEFSRAGLTLARIATLVDLQRQYSKSSLLWLEVQMILDVVARLMMCAKSVADDVAWSARKGFLHSSVEESLLLLSARISIPVLLIDLSLNSVRLAQGVVDAFATTETSVVASRRPLFSLLSTYDEVDVLLRRASEVDSKADSKVATPTIRAVVVRSRRELLWKDSQLRWILFHEVKLVLDLIVAFCMAARQRPRSSEPIVAICGLISGLISVARVWNFGR
jgi:hypothetical protein